MNLTGRVSWDDDEPLGGATIEVRGPQRRRVRHWEYTKSLHLLVSSTTDDAGKFKLVIDATPSDHLSVLIKTPRAGIVFVGRLIPAEISGPGHHIVVPRGHPELSQPA